MSNLKAGDLVIFQVIVLGFIGTSHKDEKGVIKEIVGDMCHIQSGTKDYVRPLAAVTPVED